MARKLPAGDPVGKPKRRKSARQKAAEELQVLDPTARLAVGDSEVVVREYGFFQKSRVLHEGQAFLRDIERMVGSLDAEDDDIFDRVRPLLGVHEDFVRYAVAESISGSFAADPLRPRPGDLARARELLDTLDDASLEPLVYLWFGIAGRFFFGEITLRIRGALLKAQLDGSTSSTNSAETSSTSATAPSDS